MLNMELQGFQYFFLIPTTFVQNFVIVLLQSVDGEMTEAPAECNNKIVPVSKKKRKAETVGDAATDPIPRLIDNKWKHMGKQLSAAQHDQLLLKESKKDSQFKQDMGEAIKQSDQTFANAMQLMVNLCPEYLKV